MADPKPAALPQRPERVSDFDLHTITSDAGRSTHSKLAGDLAADLLDARESLADLRAEVARLTGERDEARQQASYCASCVKADLMAGALREALRIGEGELPNTRGGLVEMVAVVVDERDAHRASRRAYASEFPPNADGDPDVGSIHENIRKLKAERDEMVRVNGVLRAESEAAIRYSVRLDGEVARLKDSLAASPAPSVPATDALRRLVKALLAKRDRLPHGDRRRAGYEDAASMVRAALRAVEGEAGKGES